MGLLHFKSLQFFILFAVVLALFGCQTEGVAKRDRVYVKRAVDGDTLLLRSGERVRLIGVDTPESVHREKPVEFFAKEASKFTKKMVQRKFVWLEYGDEQYDAYDRILAYVFLEDGTFLNAELIKQGYAFSYNRFPHKYLDQFRQYEKEARLNAVGLWGRFSKGDNRYDLMWIGSKDKQVFHHPSCRKGVAIPEKDCQRFYSKYSPRDQGYKPCHYCVRKGAM